MSDCNEKLKSAIKLIIDEFMITGNSDLYRHMTKSIDGQNVANWFNDSQLMNLSKYHGAFELELYRNEQAKTIAISARKYC